MVIEGFIGPLTLGTHGISRGVQKLAQTSTVIKDNNNKNNNRLNLELTCLSLTTKHDWSLS